MGAILRLWVEGKEEAGVVFRICTCNLIERYERGSWCGGGVDPGEERWSLLGELSCCWHNGTRGPLDLEGGGGTLTLTAGGRK